MTVEPLAGARGSFFFVLLYALPAQSQPASYITKKCSISDKSAV